MNPINYGYIKNVPKVKNLADLQLRKGLQKERDRLCLLFSCCRHRTGEGVWLQWILGGSQRPVRSLWLHSHHEIWQCWRLWEWDPRRTVHQPSLPGAAHLFRPCILCYQRCPVYFLTSNTPWVFFQCKKAFKFSENMFSYWEKVFLSALLRPHILRNPLHQCSLIIIHVSSLSMNSPKMRKVLPLLLLLVPLGRKSMLEHSSLQTSEPCDITKGWGVWVTADYTSNNNVTAIIRKSSKWCLFMLIIWRFSMQSPGVTLSTGKCSMSPCKSICETSVVWKHKYEL